MCYLGTSSPVGSFHDQSSKPAIQKIHRQCHIPGECPSDVTKNKGQQSITYKRSTDCSQSHEHILHNAIHASLFYNYTSSRRNLTESCLFAFFPNCTEMDGTPLQRWTGQKICYVFRMDFIVGLSGHPCNADHFSFHFMTARPRHGAVYVNQTQAMFTSVLEAPLQIPYKKRTEKITQHDALFCLVK